MIEDVLADAQNRMAKAVEVLRRELSAIRTGRASPGLVENLKVEYYGTTLPLNQLASITVPEARLIVIQPWDRQALGAIEKAILKSELGLNPVNDGQVIRLVLPPLTEERRRELIKLVRRRVEEGRVAVRNVRRDCAEELRKLEGEKKASEDEYRRALDRLQKLTDRFVADVDRLGQAKEAEVMEV